MKKLFVLFFLFSTFFSINQVSAENCTEAKTACLNKANDPSQAEQCKKEEAACNAKETKKDNEDSNFPTKESEKTKTSEPKSEFYSKFDPDKIFPNWDEGNISGIIGKNRDENKKISLDKGETKLLLFFIPQLTTILLKIVAPIVVFMFIFAGVRFVYAGDDEEQLKASKTFFQYGIMGIVFIIFSYSFMKSIYYILSEKAPSVAIERSVNSKTIKTKIS